MHVKVVSFFALFCNELYDCGFAVAVESVGLHRIAQTDSLLMSLSYLKGYADACRLANTYLSPQWEIANLFGIAAGTARVLYETSVLDASQAQEQWERCAATYVLEFKSLLAKKSA